jgi:hypothetical protein
MSVNRIGHMIDSGACPSPAFTTPLLSSAMAAGAANLVRRFQREHPGEQCYLVVLDTHQGIVQDLLRDAGLLQAAAASEAAASRQEGGRRPDVAMWLSVVPRASGVQTARYFAKDEQQIQAMCDQMAHHPVMGIVVAEDGMTIGPLDQPSDPAATERARRQARARRHSR